MRAKLVPRRRLHLLAAPDGRYLCEGSGAFLEAAEEPASDCDAVRFAVVNLGFVALRREGLRLDILLHPRTADSAAIDAAITLIGTSGAARFTIAWLAALGWQRESMRSAPEVCIRLMELCCNEQGPPSATVAVPRLDEVARPVCRS